MATTYQQAPTGTIDPNLVGSGQSTPSSNVISSASMQPGPTFQPVPTPTDTTDHNATTKSVTQQVIDDYAGLKTAQDTAQTGQSDLSKTISDLIAGEGNKVADTQAANTTAGVDTATIDVNKYTQQLADLNSQASSLNREAQAIPIQTQERNANTGATDAGIAPQNAGALRLNALKALSLAQQSDIAHAALTGSTIRLQAAKDKAQQIVDLKYAPLEAQLKAKQAQYDLNKDALNEIDKKASDALQVSLKKEADDLATKKANDLKNSDLILNAQTQGASSSVIAAAKKIADAGGTPLAVGSTLGPYAGDYLGTQLKKAQIVEANANAAKTRAETAVAAAASDPSNLAQQLVSGNLAPSELSKRATGPTAYNAVLKAADEYSMKTTGKHFNIAQADRNYKYATNAGTQNTLNYLGSLIGSTDSSGNIVGGNLDALVHTSDSLARTNFPAVNSVKWNAMLQTGSPDVVAYMTTVTEVADQVAKILQGGSGGGGTSDAKLSQANSLFDKGFSADQIKAVAGSLKPLLINRAKGLIGSNAYLSDYATQFGLDNPGQVGGVVNNPYSAVLNPLTVKTSVGTSIINANNGLYNIPN